MARSKADLLARRIESQAMISAVPGQMRDLEQIAREVRALGEERDDGCPYCGRYCICGRLVEEDE